jgi:hypothetical protein
MCNTLMHINMNFPSIKTNYVFVMPNTFHWNLCPRACKCLLQTLEPFFTTKKNTFYSLIHNNQLKIRHNIQQIYLKIFHLYWERSVGRCPPSFLQNLREKYLVCNMHKINICQGKVQPKIEKPRT